MKEHWKLVHKDTGRPVTYTKFKDLEDFCREQIESGTDNLYHIKYFCNGLERETNEVTDYFYRLGESPEELKVDN
jgi:hypothetical protein